MFFPGFNDAALSSPIRARQSKVLYALTVKVVFQLSDIVLHFWLSSIENGRRKRKTDGSLLATVFKSSPNLRYQRSSLYYAHLNSPIQPTAQNVRWIYWIIIIR